MIPEWLPNIHPLVVHFPIALLAVAVIIELVRLVMPERTWLTHTVMLSYVLGTLGLVASFITGRSAAETVDVAGQATTVLTTHEDWALASMIFFIVLTLIRGATLWFTLDRMRSVISGLAVLGLIGMWLVWVTGERGAELVFRHGAGVQAVEQMQHELQTLEEELEALRGAAAPQVAGDGSQWSWRVAPGSEQALRDAFHWIEGESGELDTRLIEDGEGGHALTLEPAGGPVMLVMQEPMQAVEGRLQFNADDFDGAVELVHNVEGPDTYQYLRLAGGVMGQGQITDGADDLLGEGEAVSSGWKEMRVQASGGHFYGHLNGEQQIHTHASQMNSGYAGLRISGSGTLLVRRLSFERLE